jgi:hypothetical protein
MKKMLLGLVLLSTVAVPAEAARVRWEGHFIIKEAAGTCDAYNPRGTRGNVHFEPQIPGSDNGPGASFMLYRDLFAAGYRLSSGRGNFNENFKTVDTVYAGSGFAPDETATVRIRFVRQRPDRIEASTNFITIVAEIRNFDFMPGCTVGVHMALIKRLE